MAGTALCEPRSADVAAGGSKKLAGQNPNQTNPNRSLIRSSLPVNRNRSPGLGADFVAGVVICGSWLSAGFVAGRALCEPRSADVAAGGSKKPGGKKPNQTNPNRGRQLVADSELSHQPEAVTAAGGSKKPAGEKPNQTNPNRSRAGR